MWRRFPVICCCNGDVEDDEGDADDDCGDGGRDHEHGHGSSKSGKLEARIVGPCEVRVKVLAIVTIALATMTVTICALAASSFERSQQGFDTRDRNIAVSHERRFAVVIPVSILRHR